MKQNNIENWLTDFKSCWVEKDIDSLLCLFSDQVEYYETSTQKLTGKEEISEVWQEVKNQENINLEFSLYCSEKNRHSVKWKLDFTADNGNFDCYGLYLIELDNQGKCSFFYQCTEKQ